MSTDIAQIAYLFAVLAGSALTLSVALLLGAWAACWWIAILRGEI